MKKKAITHFRESDVASIINEKLLELQTPEGEVFKSLQSTPNTVVLKIANQTFIISVTDKLNAN